MSKKINYQFSALPVEWLINSKLSSQEKIILAILIAFGDENGRSSLGYKSLGAYAGIQERQCKSLVKNLIYQGYITILNNFRPAFLRVRLDSLGGENQAVVNGAINCTIYHNSQKKECNLLHDRVQFIARNSAENCTLIKEKEKNTARVCARIETETGDGAPVRSMHKAGEPAENQQKKVQATEYEFTIEDLELFESIKDILIDKNNYYFIQFFKVNEIYGFRPVGAVSIKTADAISQSIIDAAEKIGRILTFVPFDTKYNGEIIINFQQLITKGE